MTAMSGSAGGYYQQPLPYHYPPSSSSRGPPPSSRTEEELEYIKKTEAAFQKQEESFKQIRDQLAAEAAERTARDNLREAEIKQQEAAFQAKLADAAAKKKVAEEIAAAEKKAKEKAEAEAAEKAKKLEKKSKEAEDKHKKEIEELKKAKEEEKKKHEEAKKEADSLRPGPDEKQPPMKFKDAAGRTWQFPWKFCKQWKVCQLHLTLSASPANIHDRQCKSSS